MNSSYPNWEWMVGTDGASLELRCLSHYMAPFDGGAYGRAVIHGKESEGTDVHSLNARAINLDPQRIYVINGKQTKGRNTSKTFIYAYLYGAGDEKIGLTVGTDPSEIAVYLDAAYLSYIKRNERKLQKEDRKITPLLLATCVKGGVIKDSFLAKTPALKKVKDALADEMKARRVGKLTFIQALDGRLLPIRSEHAALNTQLQSAGALICKKWMVRLDQRLRAEGLRHDRRDGDYAFLVWAHDELQVATRTREIAEHIGATSKLAMKDAEEFFAFKCPLDAEFKIGRNWAETH